MNSEMPSPSFPSDLHPERKPLSNEYRIVGGERVYDVGERINQDALNEKRDEYARKAVLEVLNTKSEIILKRLSEFIKDNKLETLESKTYRNNSDLNNLVINVQDALYKSHFGKSEGDMDFMDKTTVTELSEVYYSYPPQLIKGLIVEELKNMYP